MKKTVGIITVYGENNYGNKLQNYASIKIYESMNMDVKTIRGIQSRMNPSFIMQLKIIIKKILSILPFFKKYKYEFIREKRFKDFSKKNLNITKKINLKSQNQTFFDKFDFLSIGSDQVWNDSDFDDYDLKYFLATQAKKSKKIALSPSIGKNYLKKENEVLFTNEIKKFIALSCREEVGSKYIKKITKKDCKILIDPTLYLNKDTWKKIEKKPEWINKEEEYIFVYFLGGYDLKLEKKQNLKIVDIMNQSNISFTTSPEEFIYLIHHANLILTDSFHACVFSIIFNKNFKVFERIKQNCIMTSRIENLFNLFKIKLCYGKINEPSKWKNKNIILDEEKKKMTEYLQNAIN